MGDPGLALKCGTLLSAWRLLVCRKAAAEVSNSSPSSRSRTVPSPISSRSDSPIATLARERLSSRVTVFTSAEADAMAAAQASSPGTSSEADTR